MCKQNSISNESNAVAIYGVAKSTKARIRGKALDGAEQRAAVYHTDYQGSRSPDTELRLDNRN
jgi:hypothetical protein